jgi:hypothetical protein
MIEKSSFTKEGSSWELKKSGMFFLGKEVCITIDTKTDTDHPDREIFDEQMKMINQIHPKWEELAVVIEKEILGYESIAKEELLRVMDSPRIWLDMDDRTNKPRKNNHWSFVLGVNESEDFGWHVEFEGKRHLETWAGD